MPRRRRIIPINAAMHIICRGNNKQRIFLGNKDKSYYYSLLRKYKEENRITIFHYCFMNNHIHLIIWLNSNSTLSKFMKQVNLSYFKHFRKNYDYCGHFWQDRFRSNIIETDTYLMQCGKYIELNPVRAGLINLPEEFKFSSYNYYAKGYYDALVNPNPVFLGLSNYVEERRKNYIEFVIDSDLINTEKLKNQLFIGSEKFIKRLQDSYHLKNARLKRGRPKKTK